MDSQNFLSSHGRHYHGDEQGIIGFAVIPVLPWLIGLPWDDYALGWVHSLRPGRIRVTKSSVTCDASPWRVTIYINEESLILGIDQEVLVGGGTGEEMCNRLPKDNRMLYDEMGKYFP